MTQPDFELYPDENEKIGQVLIELGNKFEFTEGSGDGHRRIFEMAVVNEFGKIGIKARVNWTEICSLSGGPTGVWQPGVEVYGRTKDEPETDHDRMKYGIIRGLADGQSGFVREDGSLREDPRRKDIF